MKQKHYYSSCKSNPHNKLTKCFNVKKGNPSKSGRPTYRVLGGFLLFFYVV